MATGVIRGALTVAGTALAVPALMLIPSAAGAAHAASLSAKPATEAGPNWVAYTDDPDWVAYTDDSWIGHGNNRGTGHGDHRWIAHGNNRWIGHGNNRGTAQATDWPSGLAHGNNRGTAHSDDRA